MSPGNGGFAFRDQPKVYSVADLTGKLRKLIEDEFPDVRVNGEISNARRYRSGHWYFTLKDADAQISCVCFRGNALFLKIQPEDGLAVIARGRVGVYPKQGKYQLYVESLEPHGVGALQVQFDRLKARLEAEGLFAEERKRTLPSIPRRIGIVTSPSGAVIADMLRVMERRFPGLHVRLFPVRVQGQGAAAEIATGIRHFSERRWADVVIVGRGGGSLEDLWAFNEEPVARAIATCTVPVVSAVGHETDFTIADFVADLRAATPSAAIELAVPEVTAIYDSITENLDKARKSIELRLAQLKTEVLTREPDRLHRIIARRIGEVFERLDDAEQGLCDTQATRLKESRRRLDYVEKRLAHLDLRTRLVRQLDRLNAATILLGSCLRKIVDHKASRLGTADARLVALSPLAILERGYAIVQRRDGSAVRDYRQVTTTEILGVRLHKGGLTVRVEKARPSRESYSPERGDSV